MELFICSLAGRLAPRLNQQKMTSNNMQSFDLYPDTWYINAAPELRSFVMCRSLH